MAGVVVVAAAAVVVAAMAAVVVEVGFSAHCHASRPDASLLYAPVQALALPNHTER